ncbi:MAG: 50S ribosomal protein L25/general stress protein Ctc [Chlorobium sp.]|nr:MAG: 50S ribosomal protein L25/general stress protein Ctc [Chlorobium sp.]
METIVLGVQLRAITKNGAEKLRSNGQVPGVIYHKGEETVPVSVNEIALEKLVHSPESHIIDLQFPDGKVKRSVIKDVQFHPVTDRIIHTDFQLFSADEVVELEVPVSVTGNCIGIEKGGKLLISLHSLTLKGRPDDMPDHLVIDISALEIGHSIHVNEIPMASYPGLTIMVDPKAPVITVQGANKETEETAVAAESAS